MSTITPTNQRAWRIKLNRLQCSLISMKTQLSCVIRKTNDVKTLEVIEQYQNVFIGFDQAIELFKRDAFSLGHFHDDNNNLYRIKRKNASRLHEELQLAEEMISGIEHCFRQSFSEVLENN